MTDATSGLTPSLAIKFSRDGMRSVNHLANVSFETMEGWNFFGHNYRSRVDFHENECAALTIERIFLDDNPRPHSLGLSEFSKYKQDGSYVGDDYDFPFELWFEPEQGVVDHIADILNDPDSAVNSQPWYDQLKTIPDGTSLFKVWAKSHPDDANDSDCNFSESRTDHIADIVMAS